MAIIIPSPLALYGDASGKEEDPIIAVGGAIARTDEWLKFEPEWNAVLEEFCVPYFHMREFAHSIEAYKVGWKKNEIKRKAFIDALVKVIVPHVSYWMGACVLRSDYEKVDADYKLHEQYYPYTFCAMSCVDQAVMWRNVHWPTIDMECFFECGDPHRGQLTDAVHAKFGMDPTFRHRDTVPLQVADFAAYEVRYIYNQLSVSNDIVAYRKARGSFKRLWEIPAKWGQFEESGLRVFCRMNDIPRRQPTAVVSGRKPNSLNS